MVAGAPPVIPTGGGHPLRGKGRGYNILPDFYETTTNNDESDILTFIVSWTLKQ